MKRVQNGVQSVKKKMGPKTTGNVRCDPLNTHLSFAISKACEMNVCGRQATSTLTNSIIVFFLSRNEKQLNLLIPGWQVARVTTGPREGMVFNIDI